MERLHKELEKELQKAKRELGLLKFKRRNCTDNDERWYFVGAIKQAQERVSTIVYLLAICETELEKQV